MAMYGKKQNKYVGLSYYYQFVLHAATLLWGY